ncbi:MAG: tyrosine-type recombinase/integrase [Chloroflexaceae bacterium]|nr:tyrosine-type recombinase/integrase [Chloroflexaceae bacterium]
MAKRRAKGEGSVSQRSSDGRWQASLKDPATGKRVYVYGQTQREVTEKLRELRKQLEQGVNLQAGKQPLADFLAYWLKQQSHWGRRTYAIHSDMVRLHIVPYIGTIKLAQLSVQHVLSWQQELVDQKSASTAKFALRTLKQALRAAVRWEMIGRSVAEPVDPPYHEERSGQALTPPQVEKMLRAAEAYRYCALFHLAVQLGLRKAELLALKWADLTLDSDRPTLTVRKGKTKHAKRTLPLSPDLVERLRELWQEQQQERHGPRWREQGAVFATRNGSHLVDRNLDSLFKKRILPRAGLPSSIRFHDLRHTALTRLHEAGVAPAIVQAIAGHSSPSMSLSVYTHVDTEAMRRAMLG